MLDLFWLRLRRAPFCPTSTAVFPDNSVQSRNRSIYDLWALTGTRSDPGVATLCRFASSSSPAPGDIRPFTTVNECISSPLTSGAALALYFQSKERLQIARSRDMARSSRGDVEEHAASFSSRSSDCWLVGGTTTGVYCSTASSDQAHPESPFATTCPLS